MNRTMTVKPNIKRRCQVALCSNMVSNSIARTDAPGGANLLICDDCLREAFEARFGRVYTAQDVAAKDTEIAQLRGKTEAMERERAADTFTPAQPDKTFVLTIPSEREIPAHKPKDKPTGGHKR